MPGSSYFQHTEQEQDLVQDLIDESINMMGERLYYIPRSLSADGFDLSIFNEDRLSTFDNAFPFIGYIEGAQMEGSGFLMQKFGEIVDYSYNITISRKEFSRAIGQHGGSPLIERPAEGDLIYFPNTDQLLQIQFVDDKQSFLQLGKFHTYKLTCELMQYNNQQFNTNNSEIDVFESLKSVNQNPNRSLNGGVTDFEIVDPGAGYQLPPEIVINSLTGSGAMFFVSLDEETGGISGIQITDPGSQYHSDDQAIVIGPCEKQAVLKPIIKTITEHAGDGYGSNVVFNQADKEDNQNTWHDGKTPFGGLKQDEVCNIDHNLQPCECTDKEKDFVLGNF